MSGAYYEFELQLCNGVYQYATLGYDPKTKVVEDLAGSGQFYNCPYLP